MKAEIEKFVKEWMEGQEEDTFVKNEHGVYIYRAGHSRINLKAFFEELVEDWIESKRHEI